MAGNLTLCIVHQVWFTVQQVWALKTGLGAEDRSGRCSVLMFTSSLTWFTVQQVWFTV